MKPKLFIASSSESLAVARAIQEQLERDAEARVWAEGVFEPSRYALSSLNDELSGSDFGIFVFTPDDLSSMRGSKLPAVRDNVLFELGLCMGVLGRERSFIIAPRGDLRWPTDLLGLTPMGYEHYSESNRLLSALGPACNQIRRQIEKLGVKDAPHGPSGPSPKETASLNCAQLGLKQAYLEWLCL